MKDQHITPVLRELHWLPVRQRIRYKLAMTVYKCLHGLAPTYWRTTVWQSLPLLSVRWHRVTVSTKNKDHAGEEEFHGRRSSHLKQFTSHHANCNSLPIDVRSTSESPPVRLIDSASEDQLWHALLIYSSASSSHPHLVMFLRYSKILIENRQL